MKMLIEIPLHLKSTAALVVQKKKFEGFFVFFSNQPSMSRLIWHKIDLQTQKRKLMWKGWVEYSCMAGRAGLIFTSAFASIISAPGLENYSYPRKKSIGPGRNDFLSAGWNGTASAGESFQPCQPYRNVIPVKNISPLNMKLCYMHWQRRNC